MVLLCIIDNVCAHSVQGNIWTLFQVWDVLSAPSTPHASAVTEVLRGLPVILGDDPSTFFKACFVSNLDFSLPPLLLPTSLAPPIHYLPSSSSISFSLSPPHISSSPVYYLPSPPFTSLPRSPVLYLPSSLPTIHIILRCTCVNSFFFIIVVWKKKKKTSGGGILQNCDMCSPQIICGCLLHLSWVIFCFSAFAALDSGRTLDRADMWAVYL